MIMGYIIIDLNKGANYKI